MKKLNYKEIYYTSSARSIISHSTGFGVRTFTSGMDSNDVVTIAEKCVFGYSLEESKRLTFEQIHQNPRIVYDYSPTYVYQKVTLDDGSEKYVFGRTVYIGIDYGYFCNRTDAMRTGTNYFTHLLVFDEMPPMSVMYEIMRNNLFAPVDYTCAPDNRELIDLLTGDPQFLPLKSIECSEDPACDVDEESASCIIGFLQSYCNTVNNKEENLRKIIIQAPADKTPELIGRLSLLPQKLICDKTYMSNYMQGNGVPDDFCMIYVNEFNTSELYPDNHICVDLLRDKTTNIDDNHIYKKIIELSAEGDNRTIKKLIDYYLSLDLTQELDYQFLYNLFIALESDKEILLQDITPEFLNRLRSVNLSAGQETELWYKINESINRGLTSKRGAEVNQAINVVGYVLSGYRNHLKITPESSAWITNVIFGENSYLAKIVNRANVDIVLTLIDRSGIVSDTALYKALNQSQDTLIWIKFIQFYYGNNLKANVESVIESILSSGIRKEEKGQLIISLYPVEKCQNELLSYILTHTSRIMELMEMVKAICLNSREERFSLILMHCNYDMNIAKALSPLVLSFYDKMIGNDADAGMKSLLSFVDRISVDVFNMMGVSELFGKYVRASMENPSKETEKTVAQLLSSNIIMDKNTSEQIALLHDLYENLVPRHVNVRILQTAHKLDKVTDYIIALYEAWLKTQPDARELKEYIKGVDNLPSDLIGEMILATWESRVRNIRDNREDFVLIISDNSKWDSRDRKAFLRSCGNRDLVYHLVNSDKLIKKLTRKILNLFK